VVSAAELAMVGGAAGTGAVIGALVATTRVSWVRRRRPVPLALSYPVPSVVDRQLVRLLPPGGSSAAGGRVLCLVRGRPYDWARDGDAVA